MAVHCAWTGKQIILSNTSYFKCTSLLVGIFKAHFDALFKSQGNRANVFDLDEEIPVAELKHCIRATFLYHKVKHLEGLEI
jgi:hypothetical protein